VGKVPVGRFFSRRTARENASVSAYSLATRSVRALSPW
jgi:hypothetical protein